MNSHLEREIIPSVRDFLLETAIPQIGPQLRTVYEQNLTAREQKKLGPLRIFKKVPGSIEISTNADREADDTVRGLWEENFPDIPWFSEDSQDLKDWKDKDLRELPAVFVVDIVDGTGRLARHSDRFSSSFALVSYGKPVMGVVYQSVGDHIWVTQANEDGVFKDGKKIRVSDVNELEKAYVSTAYAWDLRDRYKSMVSLIRLHPYVNQLVGTASSVLDLVEIAEGQTDGHVSRGLKPWDMAGAVILIEQAGGKVTTWKGKDWHPFQPEILATNGKIHKDIQRLLKRNAMLAMLLRVYQVNKESNMLKRSGIIFQRKKK